MNAAAIRFGVNTYSYTMGCSAADCIRLLADQGVRDVELMMYPGHLWVGPDETAAHQELAHVIAERRIRIISLNMPNIDLNIAGASSEMRAYTLGLLVQFVKLAGTFGAEGFILGPGKANPLFAADSEVLRGYFYRALDILGPVAETAGTRLLIENMPFAFLPSAESLMAALDGYGNARIGVIYDVANGHFIGEDPRDGLRRVKSRLALVHLSDTTRQVYRHDPVGAGDVAFGAIPAVLTEVGYQEKPTLEVISRNPHADIFDSITRLADYGF